LRLFSFFFGKGVVDSLSSSKKPSGHSATIKIMARGWESKSVEAQQEAASEQSSQIRSGRRLPKDAAVDRQEENLKLARRRVLQQLESIQNERHRKLLLDSLAALDERLRKFTK
jgi:hypothetical protein